MASTTTTTTTTRAIVASAPGAAHEGGKNWALQDLTLRELMDDEILVQIVATGICHTDLLMSSIPAEYGEMLGVAYPKVVGHEGAGHVKAIGSKVTKKVEVGDPVLLSFDHCTICTQCRTGHPAYCATFSPLNLAGEKTTFRGAEGDVAGQFFGQSSFANLSAVKEGSVVNVKGLVKDEEELKLFAPLGCGFQTGAGTVVNLAKATSEDSVVVMGLGGVGLAAVMAAKLTGCAKIIGIDRVTSRLELAKTLGASDCIDTSPADLNIVEQVNKLTGGDGATIVVDTTGVPALLEAGLQFTASRGKLIFVGAPPQDYALSVHVITHLTTGRFIMGSVEGDSIPENFVPEMINWYNDGKFPIDKVVKFFKVDDLERALHEMHSGATIKPVLLW